MASSCDHITRVRAALPYDPAVPVSAATERWLCAQRRAGRLSYADGGTDVEALEGGWHRVGWCTRGLMRQGVGGRGVRV